jgi:hypothetical protein
MGRKFLKRVQFALRICLAIGLVNCDGSRAIAMESEFVRCTQYLVSAKLNHSVPSLSAEFTEAALADLRIFRARNLGDLSFAPGNKSVFATERSNSWKRQRVSRRISAILDEGKISVTDSGQAYQTAVFGTVFEGRENIRAEIQRRLQLIGKLQEDVEHNSQLMRSAILTLIYGAVGGAVLVVSPIEIQYLQALANTAVHNPMALPMQALPSLILFLAVAFPRAMPEAFVRAAGLTHYGQNELERMLNQSEHVGEGQWFYSSFDRQMSAEIVNVAKTMGTLLPRHMAMFNDDIQEPRWTHRLTSRRITQESWKAPPEPKVWLRVDQLVTFNPRTREPSLIEVLRITKELPPYPVRVPATKEVGEPTLQLAPKPQ